jgi:vitamin B12 transporter
MTTAVLLIFFGALSRLIPHPPNAVALGGIALYSGARLERRFALVVPLAALALSDWFIDFGTGRRVITLVRAVVYGSFTAIVFLGRFAARHARPARLAGLSIAGSVFFFLLSNFAVWAELGTYPMTATGLAVCYAAALPWFWNTLLADLAGTGVLFGLDALAHRARGRLASAGPAIAVGLLLAADQAQAQPSSSVSESVVVTATAVPEDQIELGAATTVITREQIERRGLRTVAEVLRSVPGLDLVQSGDTGAITSVLLRGSNSNHTLVLVDGVRMNSPYFAGYDFSTLTTENVERIEIVRGPFSALYGSDAIGGVVQVFTRPTASGLSGRASVEAGNAGQREGEAFAAVGAGVWGVAASFRDSRVGGDRTNSDWEQKNGALRLEGRLGESLRAALEAGLVDGESGTPGPIGRETPHARSPWWEERLSLPVSWRPAPGHAATVLVASVISKPGYDDPDSAFSSTTRAQSIQTRIGDTWTSENNRLTGFGSFERGKVDSRTNYGVDLDGQSTTLWGVGLEDTWKLPGGLTATGGVRYDRHSQFGSAWSPRATLVWLSPDALWKLRASGGTGFRAPTVGELYFPFVGNSSLKAEHSVSYELGVERYLPGGRVEASLFWNGFRDLIVYDFGLGQDTNVGRARTRGAEIALRQDLTPALAVDIGYTYLDAQDRDTGFSLIRRPRHRAFVAASWQAIASLTVSPRATFVGSRADNDALTGQRVENPSYVRLDLFARYNLRPLAPYVRLENLADRHYEEVDGYPAPRRRFAAGLEARF